jgi:hypothetical protein
MPSWTTTILTFGYRNYSIFRLLKIVTSAGEEGIASYKLLNLLGSHGERMQKALVRAEAEGLIKRIEGEPAGPGQFRPVYNVLTDEGKEFLRSQFP